MTQIRLKCLMKRKTKEIIVDEESLSNCCGGSFGPPGWPDCDICSECGEHSEPGEDGEYDWVFSVVDGPPVKCHDCDNPANRILKLRPQFPNILICQTCNEKHYKSDAIKPI